MRSLLVALLLAACGSESALEKRIAEYEGFKKRMCACTTKACADTVTSDAERWMLQNLGSMIEAEEKAPDKERDKRLQRIDEQMRVCAEKLGAEAP